MINKAEQTLEERLVHEIDALKRDLRELKARQPVGADILSVEGTNLLSTTLDVDPGIDNAKSVIVSFIPTVARLQLINFYVTYYIDNDLPTTTYIFPNGSALAVNQRRIDVRDWADWGESNDATGVRVFKVRVINNDAIPHTVYTYFRAYFLKGGIA